MRRAEAARHGWPRVPVALACPCSSDASKLLRPGLLEGVSVSDRRYAKCGRGTGRLARPGRPRGVRRAGSASLGMGARRPPDPLTPTCWCSTARAGSRAGAVGAAESRPGRGGAEPAAWMAPGRRRRSVASAAFIEPGRRRGRIVYLAPARPMRGALGERASTPTPRARGSRTSRERCRSSGPGTRSRRSRWRPLRTPPDDEVAALVAYLGSPAGEYFSGALLDLRGPARGATRPLAAARTANPGREAGSSPSRPEQPGPASIVLAGPGS